ncbi:MAG: hypothetical protein M3014_13230 [Chloroflexota bacterium]|nr:hypothetical protein [Chloroflexota bacterium]
MHVGEPAFSTLLGLAQSLTLYAVEVRYDDDFWPQNATARQALDDALTMKEFVLARIPATMKP